MSLLQKFKALFGGRQIPASMPATDFIYVKIPDGIGPLDRGEKYEDPLELKLCEAGVGHVSGGGSQIGDPRFDGSRPIEFCGLDVDVADPKKALTFLRAVLPEIGIPDGAELHCRRREPSRRLPTLRSHQLLAWFIFDVGPTISCEPHF